MTKRSNPQSKYRWYVMRLINSRLKELSRMSTLFSDCGAFTDDNVNDMMKRVTGHYVEIRNTPFGTIYVYLKTNTKLPAAFEAWMDDVRTWAYDYLVLDVPTPNAVSIEEYENDM